MGRYPRGTTVEVEGYLQIEPTWTRPGYLSSGRVLDGLTIERITKQPPKSPIPGSVTVKVTLRFPADVFYPLLPEAVIDVTPAAVRQNPIEVEVVEGEDDDPSS